jgi:nucleotide-binding universal stress UspA family protein
MKNILVATDLTPRSDRALSRALRLARQGARLRVLHVVDEDLPDDAAAFLKARAEKAIAEQVAALAPAGTAAPECMVTLGRGYRTILEAADEIDADLIVAGIHRDESIGSYFLGTTVERVLRVGRRPVLVVSEPPAGPYHRAMVCVDFSVHSRRAVDCALRLVPDGEAILLHVYDVPFAGLITDRASHDQVRATEEESFREMMDGEMKALVAALPRPPAKLRHLLVRGSVREEIRRAAAEHKPDVLAIGTQGRTGVPRAFLGSVAADLLDDPPCDVLAVKAW